MRESTLTNLDMDTEFLHGQMVVCMLVNGIKVNNMAKVCIPKTVLNAMLNGRMVFVSVGLQRKKNRKVKKKKATSHLVISKIQIEDRLD